MMEEMNAKPLLVSLVLLGISVSSLAADEIRNDLIRFETDIVGNFRLWTTGGDPTVDTDDNQALLNNEAFGSSYVLVSVDGSAARYGSSAGKNLAFSKRVGNEIVSAWEYRGVRFEQKLRLHRSIYSTQSNLMRVEVRVINSDSRQHAVGIRVVLDTIAGNMDQNGFCLPGSGLVQKGTKLETRVPSLLFVCDKQVKGPANLEINLYGQELVTPDLLLVSHERYTKSDTRLVPEIDDSFDDEFTGKSSVSMVWNEKTFPAGANDAVAIALGVSTKKVREGQPLNMKLALPLSVIGKENVWMGVVLENENKFWDVTKIAATIEYDSTRLALDGTPATAVIDRIDRAGKGFCSWNLRVLREGETKVTVKVSAMYRSMPVRLEYNHTVTVGNR